ncbi:hypothetical protein SPFL3102_00609 [Sporomusaceae bacterium FL31]|nr:hypothetical protein SPFL3101_01342 [Sporomusaceae bacterium FL31]GCE32812.1 hypothetical protein SPFL3102_00609 [Sporomusaceae bacterium]
MDNEKIPLVKPIRKLKEGERVRHPLFKPIFKYDDNGNKLVRPILHFEKVIPSHLPVCGRGPLMPKTPQLSPALKSNGNNIEALMVQPSQKEPMPVAPALPPAPSYSDDPEYKWNGCLLWGIVKDENQWEPLCNFAIVPVRKIFDVYINQSECQCRIEIKIIFARGIEKMTIRSNETGALVDKIKKRFPEAYIDPHAMKAQARINKYFAKQVADIPAISCFHDVGWTEINGRYIFVHDGIDTKNQFLCETGKKLAIDNVLSARGAYRRALDFLDISTDKMKIVVPWLFMHLGVLHTLFSLAGYSPDFLEYILGQTGSLKTALAKVLYSLYEGEHAQIPANFKDTKTSLEIKMGQAKDRTLIIDDLFPATTRSEKNEMKDVLSFVIRLYGDNIAKSRANVDLTLKTEFRHRGLACITGEYITGSQSSQLRCLVLEIQRGDYDGKKLSFYQKNPLILSTHLSHFIQFIQKDFTRYRTYISQSYESMREEMRALFKSNRLVDAAASLNLVAQLALEYGTSVGAIHSEERIFLQQEWFNCIVQTVAKSESLTKTVQPGIQYLIAIRDLLENKKLNLARSKTEYANNVQQYIGFTEGAEDKVIFFKHTEIYREVVAYYRSLQYEFSTEMSDIHVDLYKLEVTKVQKDGKEKISYLYKISGLNTSEGESRRPRMLAIKLNRMYQLLHTAEKQ